MQEDVPSYIYEETCGDMFVCMCRDVGVLVWMHKDVPSCTEGYGILVWMQCYVYI